MPQSCPSALNLVLFSTERREEHLHVAAAAELNRKSQNPAYCVSH